ncbi:MAG: hemolysin III family protein [Sterolibacteriaceae bacterium]|nr:hemolysin III family protein [Candidatus Methylophosphatis haderslevensis]
MYYGEKFNAITHLAGALLALAGAIVLVVLVAAGGDPWKIVSVSIYGLTLVLLYTSSTLYHSLRGRAKDILRKLDHQSIYLLIAGSYTPFCLVTLRGPWGWSLFGVVWGLALLGGLQEFRPNRGARVMSVVIYVVMGWAALAALGPLWRELGPDGFAWVAAGGILYTVGIIFYALDTRFVHAHGIWHLFVVAGSACHFVAILFYVVLAPDAIHVGAIGRDPRETASTVAEPSAWSPPGSVRS